MAAAKWEARNQERPAETQQVPTDARRRGKEHFLEWIIIVKKLMVLPPVRLALSSCCVPSHPLENWKVMVCTVGHKFGRGRADLEG